ncbi:ORF6N domain-containing protein [Patescibacteria group bacterium]|nr:ORF6N domain-containing protein [Patescibacteria group bacterium]MBU1683294.1 ORF6N domain-containing protein [Patescibacteria group bacterium]MBU1935310.1 ORF6N domain-containing protein [Patescibacteria group bacterium]
MDNNEPRGITISKKSIIPKERIEGVVYAIRNKKVMLDKDLGKLYGIETRSLIQAVKRNLERFPEDFAFQLTKEEFNFLKCQIGISNENSLRSQTVISKGRGGRRTLPYAFTEQGVAMLSSVLRSPQAIKVNIEIIRTFIKLRQAIQSHKELAKELSEIKEFMLKNSNKNNREFRRIWQAIEKLTNTDKKELKKIGFNLN